MATTVLTPTGAQIVDDGDNNWNQLSLAQGLQIFNGFFTTGPSLKIANGGTSRTDGSIPAPGAWFVTANGDITLTPTGGDIILNGLVGINDSSPGAQLDITPTDNSTIGVIIAHPSASTVDAFRMTDGGTTKVVIDNNGQVSMGGITTPQQNLTVGGTDDTFAMGVMTGTGIPIGESIYQQFQGRPYIGYSAAAGSRNQTGTTELTLAYETGSVAIGNTTNVGIQLMHSAKNIDFYTDATHAVQIDEFQQVGIGTNNPTSRLHVVTANDESVWFQTTGTAITAIDRLMYGLQLSAGTMNLTAKHTPAIKFMSTDPQFTTESPKLLAFINGEATEAYSADTDGGMRLNFATTPNAPGATNIPVIRMYLDQDGTLVVGSPSGGTPGAGTILAQAVYDDATLLTDFVFEPDYDYLPIPEMAAFCQQEKHLPTIGGRNAWERNGKPSTGEMINQLWETVEVQALYISELHERLTAVESEKEE